MSRIAHLSDLHFGTEESSVVAALARRLKKMNPDVIVVSGDLTQRAHRRQFAAAEHFLGDLKCRLIVVPGNHDIPLYNPLARALWPFRHYRERFGVAELSTLDLGNVRLIGVNTVRPERHASGRISARQRHRVMRFVNAGPHETINIVVLHHPLMVAHPRDAVAMVEHGTRTLKIWADAGVDLILSGHVHHPFALQAPAPVDATHQVWMLNAGTAISRRVRHGFANSFNWIVTKQDGDNRQLHIERWDYLPATTRFVLHSHRDVDLGIRCP